MKHERQYAGRPLNLSGIVALREQLVESDDYDISSEGYSVHYGNRANTYDSIDDFLGFLAVREAERGSAYVTLMRKKGGAFYSVSVQWGPYTNEIAANLPEPEALRLCDLAEEVLQWTTPPPAEPPERLSRTAFVGHSFHDKGQRVAAVFERLLRLLGFEVVTGKRYSSKRISDKVKERVKGKAVSLCILTEKPSGSDTLSPHLWLLQEASLADGWDKPIFFIIEEGLSTDLGIHADIEYITFSEETLHEAMLKLLEGLEELGYQL